jgi:hypothetical protein
MLSLAILICCAIIFYRIGDNDYGRGLPLCVISILVSLASEYLIPLALISIVIGQIVLFVGVFAYNATRKAPSSEPQLRSLGLPEKHVTRAWMAASIQAGLTLIFEVLAATGLLATLGFDAWVLLDVAILAALAYGVWKRSRVCALLLLTYSILNEVYFALQDTAHFSILRLIFIYFYFRGTVQLFREHRLSETSQAIQT